MSAPSSFQGQRPDAEQEAMLKAAAEHWRTVGNEAPVQAMARVEGAAQQLIGLTGTLQGIYFAVFAFSSLREQIHGWLALPFLLPVLLWLLSMGCATLVFVPRARSGADLDDLRVSAWVALRDTYLDTVDRKLRWLRWAHGLLITSFVAVLVLLGVLVFVAAPSAAGPTEIIIVTPTPPLVPTP